MKSKLNRVLELIPQISSNPGFNFDLSNNSGQHNLSIDEVSTSVEYNFLLGFASICMS